MDREELVRLAGEQALLQKDRSDLASAFNRDKLALQALQNDVNGSHVPLTPQWLQGGIQLLTRLQETSARLREL